MTEDKRITWLREAITARLDLAREAADGDSGAWFMGDKWNVYRAEDGARFDEDYQDCEHKLVAWGNVKPQSEHIAASDPQDTIARCEAELAILDRCALPVLTGVARDVVRMLASAYKHRPGYAEHWAAERALRDGEWEGFAGT